jgi:CIC family chloride channel protein
MCSLAWEPSSPAVLAFALTKDLLILKPILVACLASFLVARLFDDRSIYERQLGMELLEEDHLEARRERRGGIHHSWEGSIRRRKFQAPNPTTQHKPTDHRSDPDPSG